MVTVEIEVHPVLAAGVFATRFPKPLQEFDAPKLREALRLDAISPLQRTEEIRGAVRDLLRHGGYKPTGRGKPASEYLVQAAERGALASINVAVDACNVASLHSGLPISVVDLDRCAPPFRIVIAGAEQYVFNPSGQTIDLGGLLCLFDANGPCANAVKDSQRTKTNDETRSTLSVVWGPLSFRAHVDATVAWYRSLLESAGAQTEAVTTSVG
jgi:DNA/RNA-binding domain of Phe-tRNA-synthetase-like protein